MASSWGTHASQSKRTIVVSSLPRGVPIILSEDAAQRPKTIDCVSGSEALSNFIVTFRVSAWIGSIQFSLIFMPGLFTGRFVDFGYFKLPVGLAGAMLTLTTLLTGQCQEYWQFLLCQGLGLGVSHREFQGFFPLMTPQARLWFYLPSDACSSPSGSVNSVFEELPLVDRRMSNPPYSGVSDAPPRAAS
jgi:hypothetical protein